MFFIIIIIILILGIDDALIQSNLSKTSSISRLIHDLLEKENDGYKSHPGPIYTVDDQLDWYNEVQKCMLSTHQNISYEKSEALCKASCRQHKWLNNLPIFSPLHQNHYDPNKALICCTSELPLSSRGFLSAISGFENASAAPVLHIFKALSKANMSLVFLGDSITSQFFSAIFAEHNREFFDLDRLDFAIDVTREMKEHIHIEYNFSHIDEDFPLYSAYRWQHVTVYDIKLYEFPLFVPEDTIELEKFLAQLVQAHPSGLVVIANLGHWLGKDILSPDKTIELVERFETYLLWLCKVFQLQVEAKDDSNFLNFLLAASTPSSASLVQSSEYANNELIVERAKYSRESSSELQPAESDSEGSAPVRKHWANPTLHLNATDNDQEHSLSNREDRINDMNSRIMKQFTEIDTTPRNRYRSMLIYRETTPAHFDTSNGMFELLTLDQLKGDPEHPDSYPCKPLPSNFTNRIDNKVVRKVIENLQLPIPIMEVTKYFAPYYRMHRGKCHDGDNARSEGIPDCLHLCGFAPPMWMPIWHQLLKMVEGFLELESN